MTEDMKLLNELIKSEACANIECNYGRKTIILKESGNGKKYILPKIISLIALLS